MDKAQIKKFSQYARSTLIPEMQQAISSWKNANIVQGGVQIGNHSYNDSLSLKYSSAVTSLKKQIDKKGEKTLAEEAAYIWFNRIVALRFMEVNKYLPIRSSLFASDDDTGIPEIVKNIDSERNNCGCDKNAIDEYIGKYDTHSLQELYGLILVSVSNKLSEHYGFMFSKIDDWTALLFPRTILNASHILRDKTNGMLNIVDEDWKEVEIIGWIYQYYISERKAELDGSKDRLKNSEEIASSTQLFTPEWIVKYIVHNTVGKLDSNKQLNLSHRIDTKNNFDYDISDLSKFKVLDPASGSGHILVRAYDVLKEVYLLKGYSLDDIPTLIIRNNLYGFEIDERAHQLACFAVLMKAKADDKNIEKYVDVTKNIICIKENNNFEKVDEERYPLVRSFLKLWYNASMYGSLIRIPGNIEISKIDEQFGKFQNELGLLADSICSRDEFSTLLHQTDLLKDLYDCVIANPPYKETGKVDDEYKKFLGLYYSEEKSDLFAAFILRCIQLTNVGGFVSMVTMHSWMFLASFEKMREKLLGSVGIDSLIHHGPHGFPEISGEIVQTCSFCFKNIVPNKFIGSYLDLRSKKTAEEKENTLVNKNGKLYTKEQSDFSRIPGSPLAYRSTEKIYDIYSKNFEFPGETKKGVLTGNDIKFVRLWYEVDIKRIGFGLKNHDEMVSKNYKWIPSTSGGDYRKRYGNFGNIINMENDGYDIRNNTENSYRLRDPAFYFKECSTRGEVSGKGLSMRYVPEGILFGNSGPVCFWNKNIDYWIALMNSKITPFFLNLFSPTLTFGPEQLKKVPCIFSKDYEESVTQLASVCINTMKSDWNDSEISREFKKHPLLKNSGNLNSMGDAFNNRKAETEERFNVIKANEEELNKIFIGIYGLETEIDSNINDAEIVVNIADRERDTKSLLSYVIGCIMGRYSLDQEGLVYAGGQFDSSKYTTFKADEDGIIPILDRDYSDDDVVERTKEFVKKVWGESALDGNLNWIAESLDPESNKTADQVIRDYYNKEFYDNHCQIYQKRPIYWLFVSNPAKPKDSAFKALVYMHRYSETTIQDLRRNYVQNYQQKLLEERARIENNNDKASQKRVAEIDKINTELTAYANKLKDFAETHQGGIDLDDGVKINYGMFMNAGIVAKIKL